MAERIVIRYSGQGDGSASGADPGRFKKKHPGIGDFNELLKANGVVDTPVWRNIQRLPDLWNLCDHDKKREPPKDEIEELINGVE